MRIAARYIELEIILNKKFSQILHLEKQLKLLEEK